MCEKCIISIIHDDLHKHLKGNSSLKHMNTYLKVWTGNLHCVSGVVLLIDVAYFVAFCV